MSIRTNIILIWIAILIAQPGLNLKGTFSQEKLDAQLARKYDEFGYLDTDSESARLDAFAEELMKNPTSQGYILGYDESHIPFGKFLRRIYGDKNYLVESRGLVEPNRIVVALGGYRETFTTELWIVPKGAPPPKTTSPLSGIPADIKEPVKFDYECMNCEPVVFIDLPILREGLEYYAQALNKNAGTRAEIKMCPSSFVNRRESLKALRRAKTLLPNKYQINPRRINLRLFHGCKFADLQFWILPNR